MTSKPTCADLIQERLASRAADFTSFMEASKRLGTKPLVLWRRGVWVHTYGLCLDYHVACRGGYWDETSDYYDYLLSWGGPSDLVRFWPDGRIEYRYHDWWDGAGVDVTEEEWAVWLRDFFGKKGMFQFDKERREAADAIQGNQESTA